MSILIDRDFKFIIQGITGREAVNMTRECLDYGSQVVAGVTPGRKGRDVYGVPVFDTVKQITEQMSVDGSVGPLAIDLWVFAFTIGPVILSLNVLTLVGIAMVAHTREQGGRGRGVDVAASMMGGVLRYGRCDVRWVKGVEAEGCSALELDRGGWPRLQFEPL